MMTFLQIDKMNERKASTKFLRVKIIKIPSILTHAMNNHATNKFHHSYLSKKKLEYADTVTLIVLHDFDHKFFFLEIKKILTSFGPKKKK